jgi:CRP/FNR family cyclic AMP-dependent transcriptional regulator
VPKKQIKKFLNMDEENKKKLLSFFEKYQLVKYRKGEIILRPEENFPGIIFVKSGYIKAFRVSKEEREIALQLFKPIFYFSLINAITNCGNRHYFEAISPVELWIAPVRETLDYIKNDEALSRALLETILCEFVDLTKNIELLISGDAYGKVAGLIYYLAKRFGEESDDTTQIKFRITHRLIASLTGLTRETVTLQMIKLEKEGYLINKNRQVFVEDMAKLKEIAEI